MSDNVYGITEEPRWVALNIALQTGLEATEIAALAAAKVIRLGRGPGGALFLDWDLLVRAITPVNATVASSEVKRWLAQCAPKSEPVLTLTAAATYAKIGPVTLRTAIDRGELACNRIGSRKKAEYEIHQAELDRWILSRPTRADTRGRFEAVRSLAERRRQNGARTPHQRPKPRAPKDQFHE